ncbi:argininosuccinate lyase [Aggregatibacter aphrophilus NJ8700]|nr:argininosuccinate lyase [Aggregatibacter aphrophilus NJ8700]
MGFLKEKCGHKKVYFYDRTLEEVLGESYFCFCNGFRDT